MESLLAAAALTWLWSHWVWPILLFVIGLGLVVFVHELGHFLAAKGVGIKVERFALGFGPAIVAVKVGETEYCLCVLPLGGYVKMLGQEDVKAAAEDPDPRSWNNKTVGARFIVIAAGVVMNVILSAILFFAVGLMGKSFLAPRVGGVIPSYPAARAQIEWQAPRPAGETPAAAPSTQPATAAATMPATATARSQTQPAWPATSEGLRGGDEILAVNGDRVTRFDKMMIEALLADADDTFKFRIARTRDGVKHIGVATLGVEPDPTGQRYIFGIAPPDSLTFDRFADFRIDSPFREGDVIQSLAGREVANSWDLYDVMGGLTGRPVTIIVRRENEDDETSRVAIEVTPEPVLSSNVYFLADGTVVRGNIVADDPKAGTVTFEGSRGERAGERFEIALDRVLDVSLDDAGRREDRRPSLELVGLIPRLKIIAVSEDSASPAKEAGLQPGDVIVAYAGNRNPTLAEFHEISARQVGEQTTITVLRDGEVIGPLEITPKTKDGQPLVGMIQGADFTHTVIADVRANSPAAAAGVVGEDVITAVNDRAVETWTDIHHELTDSIGEAVTFTVQRGARELQLEIPELTAEQFSPGDVGFVPFRQPLKPLEITIHKSHPVDAVVWGVGETWYHVIKTYASLRSILKGNVSTKELRGPVGIGGLAVEVGRRNFSDFVYFLALISAAIAVFNFLPLPVLDGGHAVFLLIEKVRGKPVPAKVQGIVQIVGLVAILALFLWITWNDIARWIEGMW